MTTKKATKKAAPKKRTHKASTKKATPKVKKAPETRRVDPPETSLPVRGLNDTRGPNAPVEGHFVDVVEGEHKGRYGTWVSTEGDFAVVRTRDAYTDLFTVPISALRPAEAGRR